MRARTARDDRPYRKVINGGDVAIATGSGQDHHTIGDNCDECHTGVHGVGAISNVDAFVGLLLKGTDGSRILNPATNVAALEATLGSSPAGWTSAPLTDGSVAAGERMGAVGMFCVGCHSGSYQNASPSVAGNFSNGVYLGTKTGHRVMAVANADWNVGGVISSSAKQTGQVAFANADTASLSRCRQRLRRLRLSPLFTPGAAPLNSGSYLGAADVGPTASASPLTRRCPRDHVVWELRR